MKVILAKNNGFCMGVKRAVSQAKSLAGENVYIYGELVHNKLVNDELLSMGLKIVDDPLEVKSGTVIIRSHGTTKSQIEDFRNRGINVVDCTCPFVC